MEQVDFNNKLLMAEHLGGLAFDVATMLPPGTGGRREAGIAAFFSMSGKVAEAMINAHGGKDRQNNGQKVLSGIQDTVDGITILATELDPTSEASQITSLGVGFTNAVIRGLFIKKAHDDGLNHRG